jgi:D-alanyl-D-alanine dipeptidase
MITFRKPITHLPNKLPEGFVYLTDIDTTIPQEVSYAGTNNFVGRPIQGYTKACVILTIEAARALSAAQGYLRAHSNNQHTLKVYDGYRPKQAVLDFWQWSQDITDIKMQASFYPSIEDKTRLFQEGYIAKASAHSRGSAIDLTIATTLREGASQEISNTLDMGSRFDFLDPISHYAAPNISTQAQVNRKYLRDLMLNHGFLPYEKEWWHFSLQDEPFPDTYFDFPVA